MMKSELFSLAGDAGDPRARVRLARRRGAAADADDPRPRRLRRALALLTHGFEISIWAMNFALMFALALGIDYALFVVHRFRGAYFGSKLDARDAVAVTMDTAGKAVLFSGVTVLISLSAVMLVPSPAFRSMALGIMLSVALRPRGDADAAARGAREARAEGRRARRCAGCIRASTARRRSPAGASGSGATRTSSAPRRRSCSLLLALPVLGLKTGMPSIKVVPKQDSSRVGYAQVQQAFGAGAPGTLQIVAPRRNAAAVASVVRRDPGIASVSAAQPGGGGLVAHPGDPERRPVEPGRRPYDRPAPVDAAGRGARRRRVGREPRPRAGARREDAARDRRRARARLPAPARRAAGAADRGARSGHEPARRRRRLRRRALDLPERPRRGFPRLRAAGLPRRLGAGLLLRDDLRDLDGLHRVPALLGQGALRPLGRPARGASIGGLAHSGRVIFAAAAVMVAVFFTFALSGPLPPKEMGVILGIAVLLDAMLVRLDPDPDAPSGLRTRGLGLAALAQPAPARREVRALLMLELWQTEWCPASHRVREHLTELGVDYLTRQVPVEKDARAALRDATGADVIPALVLEDGSALVGEDAIGAYLNRQVAEPPGAEEHRLKAIKARRRYLEKECECLQPATH